MRFAQPRMERFQIDAVVDDMQLRLRGAEIARISSPTMRELQMTARRRGLANTRRSAART